MRPDPICCCDSDPTNDVSISRHSQLSGIAIQDRLGWSSHTPSPCHDPSESTDSTLAFVANTRIPSRKREVLREKRRSSGGVCTSTRSTYRISSQRMAASSRRLSSTAGWSPKLNSHGFDARCQRRQVISASSGQRPLLQPPAERIALRLNPFRNRPIPPARAAAHSLTHSPRPACRRFARSRGRET